MARLLHPALVLLWRMQLKAGWRRIALSAKTGKGILRLIVIAILFAMTFGPMIAFFLFRDEPDPALARSLLEPGIFLFTLLIVVGNGANSGVFFTPSEVDFLFPGPFHRRELILYRLGHQVRAALFGALFFSVAPAPLVPHWVYAFFGIALVLQFIQLLSTGLSLTLSLVGQAAYTRGRRAVLAGIGVLIFVGLAQAAAGHSGSSGGDVLAMLKEFQRTTIGHIILLPFQVFSRTIAAERLFPQFLGWASVALTMNAALVVLIVCLDSNFYEQSVAVSERIYRALENAKRGQAWKNFSKPSVGAWRLPMLPRWQGAGPIAWRQCITALRSFRGVIYVVMFMTAMMAFVAYLTRESGSGLVVAGLVAIALFTFPQMLQFDFRGDIERIDFLKTLPASAVAIAVGELVVPIAVATIIEWALVLGTGLLWTDSKTILLVCASVPTANLIVFGVENLIFLYHPRRVVAGNPFQAPGGQMVINFVKVVALVATAGVTAGFGAFAFWISNESMIVGIGTAWCVMVAMGVALVPLVAHAFRVLDPSAETAE